MYIILIIYVMCLPISLMLLANRDSLQAVDKRENSLLLFFKIWLISPFFILRMIINKFF
nr:MAG TPA: hypothetical protein [Caudoviricetes sp.]